MKKILAMTLAIFLLCVAQVSAKEYYCGKSSDGFKVYFLSESAARYDSNPPKFTKKTGNQCIYSGILKLPAVGVMPFRKMRLTVNGSWLIPINLHITLCPVQPI